MFVFHGASVDDYQLGCGITMKRTYDGLVLVILTSWLEGSEQTGPTKRQIWSRNKAWIARIGLNFFFNWYLILSIVFVSFYFFCFLVRGSIWGFWTFYSCCASLDWFVSFQLNYYFFLKKKSFRAYRTCIEVRPVILFGHVWQSYIQVFLFKNTYVFLLSIFNNIVSSIICESKMHRNRIFQK